MMQGLLQFHGVYCEATAKVPFKLLNKVRINTSRDFFRSLFQRFTLQKIKTKVIVVHVVALN